MNNQQEMDTLTIKALNDNGSNMDKLHEIEHHFVSKNKKNISQLFAAVKDKYNVSEILSTGLIFKTYFFDIIKETVPTIENISPDTKMMNEFANQYSCDYDGWGCGVEK